MPVVPSDDSASLSRFVSDFARGIELADARRPQAVNVRTGVAFRPGIGPHAESQTVSLVMRELTSALPERYAEYAVSVPYPGASRQRCDLCLGTAPSWGWAIEVKMLRLFGDNDKLNDNMLMHILSPYAAHRSALTDCEKLVQSGLSGRKAILIYGFGHAGWPLDPGIDAFETLARARIGLSDRHEAAFAGLVHPVHAEGRVFAWEAS